MSRSHEVLHDLNPEECAVRLEALRALYDRKSDKRLTLAIDSAEGHVLNIFSQFSMAADACIGGVKLGRQAFANFTPATIIFKALQKGFEVVYGDGKYDDDVISLPDVDPQHRYDDRYRFASGTVSAVLLGIRTTGTIPVLNLIDGRMSEARCKQKYMGHGRAEVITSHAAIGWAMGYRAMALAAADAHLIRNHPIEELRGVFIFGSGLRMSGDSPDDVLCPIIEPAQAIEECKVDGLIAGRMVMRDPHPERKLEIVKASIH